ncbi:MAG TPA: hypothetical protein VH351_11585 [Bryobacteraceae bacterium]|jgi:hypothetical protein|nr:hypothetical protein [Bryobacteraceae bacterium]
MGRAHRRTAERGSALLIVFVFAAIIAILLYRELPVSVFEAKRQKEQLLVDRGHEYVRAIQLFYRRNHGQYPASIEQLESTNNIRYLRRRYKDPFTGKDDWRLLHAGPGGLLVDSKVSPQGLGGIPGQPGAAPAPFGSTASSSSPQSISSTDNSSSDAVVVPPVVQRGPAVAVNGEASGSGQPPSTGQLDQNPDQQVVPSAAAVAATTNGAAPATGPALAAAAGGPAVGAQVPGAPNGQQPGIMQTMAPILGNPTNQGAQGIGGAAPGNTFNSGNSLGRLNGGGALAGIASIAKGHSIKIVDEQSDYSLWEFHYDPSKDTSLSGGAGPAGNLQNGQAAPAGAFGRQNTNQQGMFAQPNQPGTDQSATGADQQNPNPDQTNQPNPGQANPNQANPNQANPNQPVPMQALPLPQ